MRAATLTRQLIAAVLVAGVTTTTVLVAPGTARAVPGLQLEVEMSNVNSSTTKTVTAMCPVGTTVVGGGGYAGNGGEDVFVTGLEPVVSMSGTGYRTTATEDDTGSSGSWFVIGYAICAPAPEGLEYVSTSSPPSSQPSQGVSAECPARKKVLGTGAVVDGGGRHVGLSHVLPTPDALTHVAAVAHEDETGFGGTWSVTAFAVCADPLPRHHRVVGYDPGQRLAAPAFCPAGTQVHGVGGYVNGGWGEVRLTGAYPFLLAGAYLAQAQDETGYAGTSFPVAVAVCAG